MLDWFNKTVQDTGNNLGHFVQDTQRNVGNVAQTVGRDFQQQARPAPQAPQRPQVQRPAPNLSMLPINRPILAKPQIQPPSPTQMSPNSNPLPAVFKTAADLSGIPQIGATFGNAVASGVNYVGDQLSGAHAQRQADIAAHTAAAANFTKQANANSVMSPQVRSQLLARAQGETNMAQSKQQFQQQLNKDVQTNNDPLKPLAAGAQALALIALPGAGKVAEGIGTGISKIVPAIAPVVAKTIGAIAEGGVFNTGFGALNQLQETGSKTNPIDLAKAAPLNFAVGGALAGALPLAGAGLNRLTKGKAPGKIVEPVIASPEVPVYENKVVEALKQDAQLTELRKAYDANAAQQTTKIKAGLSPDHPTVKAYDQNRAIISQQMNARANEVTATVPKTTPTAPRLTPTPYGGYSTTPMNDLAQVLGQAKAPKIKAAPVFKTPMTRQQREGGFIQIPGKKPVDPLIAIRAEDKARVTAWQKANWGKQKPYQIDAPANSLDNATLYHGTNKSFKDFNPASNKEDYGTWFSNNKNELSASNFKYTHERTLKPGTKLMSEKQVSDWMDSAPAAMTDAPYPNDLLAKGYRGVQYGDGTVQLWKPNEDTIRVKPTKPSSQAGLTPNIDSVKLGGKTYTKDPYAGKNDVLVSVNAKAFASKANESRMNFAAKDHVTSLPFANEHTDKLSRFKDYYKNNDSIQAPHATLGKDNHISSFEGNHRFNVLSKKNGGNVIVSLPKDQIEKARQLGLLSDTKPNSQAGFAKVPLNKKLAEFASRNTEPTPPVGGTVDPRTARLTTNYKTTLYHGKNDVNTTQAHPDRPVFHTEDKAYAETYGKPQSTQAEGRVFTANSQNAYENVAMDLHKTVTSDPAFQAMSRGEQNRVINSIEAYTNNTLHGEGLSDLFKNPMPDVVKNAYAKLGIDYVKIPGNQFTGTVGKVGHQTEVIQLPKATPPPVGGIVKGLDGKPLEVVDGKVILTHRTTPEGATAISKSGKLDPNRAGTGNDKALTQDGKVSYLTTNDSQKFYGDTAVKVKMPIADFKKALQENADTIAKMEKDLADGKVPDMYIADYKKQIENIKANPEILSSKPLDVHTPPPVAKPSIPKPDAKPITPTLKPKTLPQLATKPAAKRVPLVEKTVTPRLKAALKPPVKKAIAVPQPTPRIDPKAYVKQQYQLQEAARKAGSVSKFTKLKTEIGTKGIDNLSPIENVMRKAIKNGADIPLSKNITPQLDRALRADSIAGQYMKDNGLAKVIQHVPDTKTLDQYLIAKHAADLHSQGIKTGRNLAADKQLVASLKSVYEPHAQAVMKYNQGLLDKAVSYGLVSKDLAASLKKQYPNYVPANRIFADGELTNFKGNGGGKASLSTQSVVQRIKGSERTIESPLASIANKTNDVISQGERNKAGSILASYKDLPGNPFNLREMKSTETVGAKSTISYLDNGKVRRFETTPEIATAAKALNKEQIGILGKMARVPTRLLRLTATGINPAFALRNISKDLVSAAINSEHPLRTSVFNLKVLGKASAAALHHGSKSYAELVREGAGGTSFDIARDAPVQGIKQIRAGRNAGTKVLYTVTHPVQLIRAVEDTIGRSEEFSRALQYYGNKDAGMKKGLSSSDATIYGANAARNNTVNFARHGEWGAVLNSALPYLNAGVQGSRTLLRNVRDRPAQTIAKVAILSTLPALTVTAWNLSSPERRAAYNDIPDFEKQGSMIIVPEHPVKDAKTGKWNVIKIPVSQEIANLNNIARNTLESAMGNGTIDPTRVLADLIGTTTSLNVGSLREGMNQAIPQGLKPFVETMTNQNLFTGNKIVPDSQKNMPAKDQYGTYTSGTAQVLGNLMNTSPRIVDNFIKTSTGGAGQNALNATDTLLAATGATPQSSIQGRTIGDSITSGFYGASAKQPNDSAATDFKTARDLLVQFPEYKAQSQIEKAKTLNRLQTTITNIQYNASDTANPGGGYTPKPLSKNEQAYKDGTKSLVSFTISPADTASTAGDPKATYQKHLDAYKTAVKDGTLSGPKAYATQQSLGKEAITSKYPQDVLDFYALSKANQNAYFNADRATATKLYDQSKLLDAELVGKGATTKFKVAVTGKKSSGSKSSGSKKSKTPVGLMAALNANHGLKTPTLKVKAPKFKSVAYKKPSMKSYNVAKIAAPKAPKINGRSVA